MKIKGRKIAIIAIIVIAIALLYLYFTNKKNSQPGSGLTIVTPMPVSGYSIEDIDGDGGFPDALPESLPDPTLAVIDEDVITGAPTFDAMTTPEPEPEAAVEEFSTYAPKNWRGNVL